MFKEIAWRTLLAAHQTAEWQLKMRTLQSTHGYMVYELR